MSLRTWREARKQKREDSRLLIEEFVAAKLQGNNPRRELVAIQAITTEEFMKARRLYAVRQLEQYRDPVLRDLRKSGKSDRLES